MLGDCIAQKFVERKTRFDRRRMIKMTIYGLFIAVWLNVADY